MSIRQQLRVLKYRLKRGLKICVRRITGRAPEETGIITICYVPDRASAPADTRRATEAAEMITNLPNSTDADTMSPDEIISEYVLPPRDDSLAWARGRWALHHHKILLHPTAVATA